MDVLLTVSNSLVQLSAPSCDNELPQDLLKRLESRLCYTHRTFRRPTYFDKRSGIVTEIRKTFQYDSKKNFLFPRGFLDKVRSDIESFGHKITVVDLDKDYNNSAAFRLDISRVTNVITLRGNQDEALASLFTSKGGIIVGPTGFGKSFMFSAICLAYPDAKIQVVTRRVDVMKRVYSGLLKFFPSVGMVGSGSCYWDRITVITADSMHRIGHCDEQLADILLYDEAHEAVAPSYQHELGKFLKTRKFGFTASPDGRMDGAHFMLEAVFGPKIFELSYSDAVSSGLVVPIKVEMVPVGPPSNCADLAGVTKERWGIWRNENRNKIIATKANEYASDEQVLIMVRSIEHAVYLKQVLPNFKLCYDSMDPEDYNRHVSKGMLDPINEPLMTPTIRESMRIGFERGTLKKVISTDVWSTGVDFAQLGVVIRADARASKIVDIQAPGRVSRLHAESGKQFGLVIDFIDNFDFTFLNRSRSRMLSYKNMGWEFTSGVTPVFEDSDAIEIMGEAFDD